MRKNKAAGTRARRLLVRSLLLLGLAAGCQRPGAGHSAAILPTGEAARLPATGTAVPASALIFRDDFDGPLQDGWTWQNEDPSRWALRSDGWLSIRGSNGNIIQGELGSNILWAGLPQGSYEVSTRLDSQPLLDEQRAGLLLYQDAQHYIMFSQGYCTECVLGGSGLFLEYRLGASHGRYARASTAREVYLLLVGEPGMLSAFYATTDGGWKHLASLANKVSFRQVGLSVTGGPYTENGLDLTGSFDYLIIRRPHSLAPTPAPPPWPNT